MAISILLPQPLEDGLRARIANLDATATEAALVELYRLGHLSHGQFADGLGVSRDEANEVLKRHSVTEDLITLEEFDEQIAAARKHLGQ